MATSDRIAREIADVKARIEGVETRYVADRAKLDARLQALKTLKGAITKDLDGLLEAAGLEFT